jgi:photosystem II stability/assembly factor-like uncharacterized protein
MVAKKILSCALICATLILMGCDGEYFNWNLERINPNDNPGTGGTGGTSGTGGTGGTTGTGGTGGTGGGTAVTILNDLNQIQFANNNIGYAVGTGVVIKSVDGGIKWVKINTSNSLEFTAIYFVNESIGYLGGNDQYYSYLFKTVDGGLTWQQLNRYWFQNERNEVMSIFASPTGDRAVALINQYPNATQVYGRMVYSSNGGSTWNTLQASRQAGFNTADLLNGSLFIGGNAYWTGSVYRTSVYTSTFLANGSLDLLENTATQVNNNPISIHQLDMVSNVGFATTSDGQFAISSDSGRNWTLKPLSGSNSGLDLTAILFTSNTVGYIGTSSGLVLMTQDAGLSWSTAFQGAIGITDLALRPDGKIAAAGKRGFIRIIN